MDGTTITNGALMEDKEADNDSEPPEDLRAVWLNKVNQFFCAMTALLLWLTVLQNEGVDISDNQGSLFGLDPGFIAKLGKCKLQMHTGGKQARCMSIIFQLLLIYLFIRAKEMPI